jgi:uncharacterized protein with FMN-binding domain/ferredoxin
LNARTLNNRWLRFAVVLAITAVIFATARLVAVGGLFIGLAVWAFFRWRAGKRGLAYALAVAVVLFGGLFLFAQYEAFKIRGYTQQNLAELMPLIPNGTYEGEAPGRRGPIVVDVAVKNGVIESVEVVEEQETVSVGGNAIENLTAQMAGEADLSKVDAVTGATYTSFGLLNAVKDALWKAVPGAPTISGPSKLVFWALSFKLHGITLNTLAILFIAALLLDYSIASALVEGTGQSLNCYDCQTCVGACPVKTVEGYLFPMDMVLAARLGDHEKVMRLAKYCVGCAKCAAKCPVGISAPSVASATATFLRKYGYEEEAEFFEEREDLAEETAEKA